MVIFITSIKNKGFIVNITPTHIDDIVIVTDTNASAIDLGNRQLQDVGLKARASLVALNKTTQE